MNLIQKNKKMKKRKNKFNKNKSKNYIWKKKIIHNKLEQKIFKIYKKIISQH